MWLSGISGYGTGSLVSQRGSTIKSPCACTVMSRYPSWYDLRCCQDIKLQQQNQPENTKLGRSNDLNHHIRWKLVTIIIIDIFLFAFYFNSESSGAGISVRMGPPMEESYPVVGGVPSYLLKCGQLQVGHPLILIIPGQFHFFYFSVCVSTAYP